MRYLLLSLVSLLLSTAIPASADDVAEAVVKAGVTASFNELEKQLIYKYFGEHPEYDEDEDDEEDYVSSGKGKHKNKGLPPGIVKKLQRGGTMPPGIAKRNLPGGLTTQLPPVPQGYERTIVGNDILLVQISTGLIADILVDAIFGD